MSDAAQNILLRKLLFDKKSVAEVLSISVRTVENLAAAKKLVVRKIGGRTLYTRESVERLARGDTPSPTRLAAEARAKANPGTDARQ